MVTAFVREDIPGTSAIALDDFGGLLWTYTTVNNAYLSAIAQSESGDMYVGGDTHIEKVTGGTSEWSTNADLTHPSICGILVDGSGNVYIRGGNLTYDYGFLKKFNSAGVLQWSYSEITDIVLSFCFDKDQNFIFIACRNAEVHKVNALTGANVWKYAGHTNSVYTVVADGVGNIYTGSSDTEVHKIDSTGANVWKYTGHSTAVNQVTLDSAGNVFSVSYDLHKINNGGAHLWTYDPNTFAGDDDTPVDRVTVTSDYIYITTRAPFLYQVELDGSVANWRASGDAGDASTWFVTDIMVSGVKPYIVDAETNTYRYNADGTLDWAYSSFDADEVAIYHTPEYPIVGVNSPYGGNISKIAVLQLIGGL